MSQSERERGFHVFYQLLSADEALLAELCLKPSIASYEYLNKSSKTQSFVFDDASDWKEMRAALSTIGVTPTEQR